MKEAYVNRKFHTSSLEIIGWTNMIIKEYMDQGFILTLRQLYYQMVRRNLIENDDKVYKKVGDIVGNGRMAGLIDWDAIEDRTRNLQGLPHWNSPVSITRSAYASYRRDHWEDQEFRPQVWVEKEALSGIVQAACDPFNVDFMCCRGYMSISEMRNSALRFDEIYSNNQEPVLIHLGDHDPSGLHMTQDIISRIHVFMENPMLVDRIALNIDQVESLQLPPNFAKQKDSRLRDYKKRFGNRSWELDALEPQTLVNLIQESILQFRDEEIYERVVAQQTKEKQILKDTIDFVRDKQEEDEND